jgi:hypothetical protein
MVQTGSGISALVYRAAPNQVTAAVAIAGGGVVLLDELGGEKGVTFYTLPTGETIPLPADRGAAIKELANAVVNPVEGAKLAEKVAQSIVRSPEGIVTSVVIPPFLAQTGVGKETAKIEKHYENVVVNTAKKLEPRHLFH